MNTEAKILQTALILFNNKGLSNISSKTISEEMAISYGNLCYHFPKKDDIIMRLHQNLLDELDEYFEKVEQEISQFDVMLKSIKYLMGLAWKYRFLFLSSYELTLKYPTIKEKSIERAIAYKKVLLRLSRFLMDNRYMHKETDQKQAEKFTHGLLIVFYSWVLDASIYYGEDYREDKDYYFRLLFSLLRPSLTKKGREAFFTVYKKMAIPDE